MHHRVESQMLRRDFMRKWHVSGVWQTQMNWYWEILMVMLGNVRKGLKVFMEGMEQEKETLKEECY